VVIIIGAGITGLAAGYELAVRGVSFQILEASSRAGGLIHTNHIDGFTLEAGADSFLVHKPAALELCEALGLGQRLIAPLPPRSAFVLKRGRLHALPSPSVLGIPTTWRAVAGYDLLPLHARVRLAMEPRIRREAHGDESVASFFRRRFGASSVPLIAEPLLGGIHAGDIESLSLRSVFPRFAEAEVNRGSVLRAFRQLPATHGSGGLFRSLPGGMGELVSALEQRLPAGSIRFDSPVDRVAREADGWRVVSGQTARHGRSVVIAAPAHAAARMLAHVDPPAAALCAEVPYASTASIALAWPRQAVAHPLRGTGFVVARRYNALRITACTWVSSKWAGRAPEGSVLLRAYAGGVHDPAVVELDDAQLRDIAARELGAVLRIAGPPVFSRVHRWPLAGAQHNVGQIARAADIESRLARQRGLFVAGSGFRSIGIPDCIADGRAAAAGAASME
jgi:oxygen-dependent protoporphyrinogen oxidase